ncbi:MAG: S8 family peptidase [Jatrophihabitans sp.]
MSPDTGDVSTDRPVILGTVTAPRTIKLTGRASQRVTLGSVEQRIQRLDGRFEELAAAFGTQVQLAESIQAADPQLVLVFEAREERLDLTKVAEKLKVEVLRETESSTAPDDEFALTSDKSRPVVTSCIHAVCLNQTALDKLLGLWRAWQRDRTLGHGYAPLRDLFQQLKDVRPWGPRDRLKMIDWDEHFAGQAPDTMHSIDIELWYRGSVATRTAAQAEVTALLEQAGGSVSSWAIVEQIGYHGLKATVPNRVLEDLASERFDAVQVVKSANVMYVKVSGQFAAPTGTDTDEDVTTDEPVPARPPVVCLLDGVPATNHPVLADRVTVVDPDDLTSGYTVDDRRHGTAMTSAVVWGDRSRDEPPAARQVLVRPILTPSDETINREEELPVDALAPDLMWRAFRDLFEDGPDGAAPAAPDIAIINLSVGDPAAPFDTVLSAWARMLDWLSYEYGVLVIVAAGNHSRLDLTPSDSEQLAALSGDDRRLATLEAIDRQQNNRRLLAPAESINALTIGATHDDGTQDIPLGYRIDPNDGLVSVSPISATGSGYRRSIKPELAWPASQISDTGPYRVRSGMEDRECQNGVRSIHLSSKKKQ